MRVIPPGFRKAACGAISRFPAETWDHLLGAAFSVLPSSRRPARPGDRLLKIAAAFGTESPERIFRNLLSHWSRPADLVVGGVERDDAWAGVQPAQSFDEFLRLMMRVDSENYLPDDILVKVDRAAMAVSLETRVPFLDHRIFEFAASLPGSLLLKGGAGKLVLRKILDRYVPRQLTDRPKTGFGIPLHEWLRGPLREWAEDLLSETALRRQGVLQVGPIRRAWEEHLSGKRAWHYQLWDVLMLVAWMDENRFSSTQGVA
jgi:asparagine synthase (glutamine-hydrolysing)